jgi:hypothetical protein
MELWEIKPASSVLNPFICARTRLLQKALPRYGYQYRLVFGEDLAQQPRLSNALELLKHGRTSINESTREHIRQILLKVPYITWGSATNGDLGVNGRAVLSRLALEGFLKLDMQQPLTPQTRFESGPSGAR